MLVSPLLGRALTSLVQLLEFHSTHRSPGFYTALLVVPCVRHFVKSLPGERRNPWLQLPQLYSPEQRWAGGCCQLIVSKHIIIALVYAQLVVSIMCFVSFPPSTSLLFRCFFKQGCSSGLGWTLCRTFLWWLTLQSSAAAVEPKDSSNSNTWLLLHLTVLLWTSEHVLSTERKIWEQFLSSQPVPQSNQDTTSENLIQAKSKQSRWWDRKREENSNS